MTDEAIYELAREIAAEEGKGDRETYIEMLQNRLKWVIDTLEEIHEEYHQSKQLESVYANLSGSLSKIRSRQDINNLTANVQDYRNRCRRLRRQREVTGRERSF